MSELETDDERIEFELDAFDEEDRSLSTHDFAKSEVERTRKLVYNKRFGAGGVGHLELQDAFIKYNRTSGEITVRYVEQVGPFHIVRGQTKVALLDRSGGVLVEWDHGLFRQCGSHQRSLTKGISRKISEEMSGLRFRTVGDVRARRC